MQRQRIVEAVRVRLARQNATDSEPDPVPGLRVDDHQHLPVQNSSGCGDRAEPTGQWRSRDKNQQKRARKVIILALSST
jgi:hypothetical protein